MALNTSAFGSFIFLFLVWVFFLVFGLGHRLKMHNQTKIVYYTVVYLHRTFLFQVTSCVIRECPFNIRQQKHKEWKKTVFRLDLVQSCSNKFCYLDVLCDESFKNQFHTGEIPHGSLKKLTKHISCTTSVLIKYDDCNNFGLMQFFSKNVVVIVCGY